MTDADRYLTDPELICSETKRLMKISKLGGTAENKQSFVLVMG